ncbi:MAG: trypsin-like peptidase domain-containing protein [Bacteroidia bacterium]
MQKLLPTILLSAAVSASMLLGYHTFFRPSPNKAASSETTPVSFTSSYTDLAANGDMPENFTGAAARATPAVVHIKSIQTYQVNDPWQDFFGWGGQRNYGTQKAESSGSGVILNKEGYIVTNNHVIKDAEELKVTLSDNRTFTAKFIGTDASTDLGVIKIEADLLTPIEFSNSDEAKVGQWVLAVGNPFNLASTVTAGIVSAIGRNLEIIKDKMAIESFIQTDAAVNPGNSGGALVDLQGRLVGVNTAISSPTGTYAGYAFAIPANIVQKIVGDLIKYGSVQRVYLGIAKSSVLNNIEAQKNDLEIQEGVLIHTLNPNGSAAEGGIKSGDVITKINDTDIKTEAKMAEILARLRPGDNAKFTIYREKGYKTLNILLKNQQGTTAVVKRNERLQELGIDFGPVPANIVKQFGMEGVQISKLYPGKVRHVGVQEGFVIQKVNDKPFKTPEEITKYLEKATGSQRFEGFYPNQITLNMWTGKYNVQMHNYTVDL